MRERADRPRGAGTDAALVLLAHGIQDWVVVSQPGRNDAPALGRRRRGAKSRHLCRLDVRPVPARNLVPAQDENPMAVRREGFHFRAPLGAIAGRKGCHDVGAGSFGLPRLPFRRWRVVIPATPNTGGACRTLSIASTGSHSERSRWPRTQTAALKRPIA